MKRSVSALRVVLVGCTLWLAGCAGSRPVSETPEPAPPESDIVQVMQVPKSQAAGLGGPNKPNGVEQRYRRWVPAETPAYVSRQLDSLELAIADETDDGWMAFYESPLRGLGPNRAYRAALFGPGGNRLWDLPLNQYLSRNDQLEIQDIRYQDGHLYFNEACQTYAQEAGGDCSALVSIHPETGLLDWRTPDLVSNDIFVFYGPYLITGYGFTNEEDYLYLVDRTDGAVIERMPLDSAHDYLEVTDRTLRVVTYNSVYTFLLPELLIE
jgi:hypothetical protein